jgi:hypothetical protein
MNYDQVLDPDDGGEEYFDPEYNDTRDHYGDYYFQDHCDACCAFGQAIGDFIKEDHGEADQKSWQELSWILTRTKQNARPSLVFTKEKDAVEALLELCPYATKGASVKSPAWSLPCHLLDCEPRT